VNKDDFNYARNEELTLNLKKEVKEIEKDIKY